MGYQHLLLELDSLLAAPLADVTFNTDHHVLAEYIVVAPPIPIDREDDRWVLIYHPRSMHHHHVAVRYILLGDFPAALGELAERHAGLDQLRICEDLLLSERVQLALLARGPFAGAH